MIKIVIDTMGSDLGFAPIITGTAAALTQGVDFFPILVGPAAESKAILDEAGIDPGRYELVNAQKCITNDDPPTCIFAGCEDKSMAMAYGRLKKDAECDAMLSAGNTGALLVGSICRLGLLPGLKFPVLASMLPCNGDKMLCLVDCGANVECTADDLARFARMGHIFSKSYCGIENPRIALMSVGREAKKGTAMIQQAHEKIAALGLNFVGNAEGSDLVTDYADVIVSDGFSGNLLLKCAESVGIAAARLTEKLGGDEPLAQKIRQAILDTFDFNSNGAAMFLGTKKAVVKMHGSATAHTVTASIRQTVQLVQGRFAESMAEELAKP